MESITDHTLNRRLTFRFSEEDLKKLQVLEIELETNRSELIRTFIDVVYCKIREASDQITD
jgi:hypothetical protein